MMFYGERKKGCRFMEVFFHGYRTLIIENDKMRCTILVDKGLDIISFVDKATDTDVVWTNPMGLSCMEKRRLVIMDEDCYSDNYLGGFFEILPNFGEACEYHNMKFSQHSEISHLPFEMSVLEDSSEKITLLFVTRLSKYPFEVRKKLTFTNKDKTLSFEEEIKNLSSENLPYLWALHPCLGEPFLDENCEFILPDGTQVNMPKSGSFENSFHIYEVKNEGKVTVLNKKSNLKFEIDFDANIFTHCGLWISAENNYGHHKFSGAYVASVLPCNFETMTLSKAAQVQNVPMLNGGEVVKSYYNIKLTDN
ncbi:MAG: DUF4432 family protein [Oscillospiraceae bacterium]|nr:DUF4432 family protein [Oscillospiraceae bacterium]